MNSTAAFYTAAKYTLFWIRVSTKGVCVWCLSMIDYFVYVYDVCVWCGLFEPATPQHKLIAQLDGLCYWYLDFRLDHVSYTNKELGGKCMTIFCDSSCDRWFLHKKLVGNIWRHWFSNKKWVGRHNGAAVNLAECIEILLNVFPRTFPRIWGLMNILSVCTSMVGSTEFCSRGRE